jgi:hypothetical protein
MSEGQHIEPTPERKSVLWRSSDYQQRCSSGFIAGAWEAHHIVCNHAVESRDIQPDIKGYAEAVLWITDWDLNNSGNMIGLPKNCQYRASDGKVPQNLCSHQVDHNTSDGYTYECTTWLDKNVWSTLKDTRIKHEIQAQQVKGLLESGTALFKGKLSARGARMGGTQHCWDRRFKSHAQHVPKWYHPFSMGANPRKRSPGMSWTSLIGIFKQIM